MPYRPSQTQTFSVPLALQPLEETPNALNVHSIAEQVQSLALCANQDTGLRLLIMSRLALPAQQPPPMLIFAIYKLVLPPNVKEPVLEIWPQLYKPQWLLKHKSTTSSPYNKLQEELTKLLVN